MDVSTKVKCVTLTLLVCFAIFSRYSYANVSTELIFCYEDKALTPMFVGVGHEVPIVKPGASIDILNALNNQLSNLQIIFQRKPWRRCLRDLASGKVDAVIASYRPERESFAVYPMTNDNKVAEKFAISKFGSCLIGRPDFHKQWKTREVFQNKAFTLAVPNGYGVGAALKDEPLFIHNTFSSAKAFELVENNVVDASVSLCQIDDEPVVSYPYKDSDVAAIYPAYEITHGYLLFSRKFYDEHPALSNQMWQHLAQMNTAKIYLSYLSD